MGTALVTMNATSTEGGANTIISEKHEIPNTSGAKAVFLMDGQLEVQSPDIEDAINYMTGVLYAGDHSSRTTTGSIGSNGAMAYVAEVVNADATPDIIAWNSRGPTKAVCPWRIFPSSDGKFYITLVGLGSGNANAKSVYFSGAFRVET